MRYNLPTQTWIPELGLDVLFNGFHIGLQMLGLQEKIIPRFSDLIVLVGPCTFLFLLVVAGSHSDTGFVPAQRLPLALRSKVAIAKAKGVVELQCGASCTVLSVPSLQLLSIVPL